MAGSLNRVSLIGRVGRDPETRSFQNGGKVVNLRIATSEKSCVNCGVTFTRPSGLSGAQWASRRFCSRTCAGLKPKSITDREIGDLYLGGLSSTEIAALAGLSGRAVLLALHRARVEMRSMSDGKALSQSRPSVRANISAGKTGVKCSEEVKSALRLRVGPKNHNWGGGLTVGNVGYIRFTASPANGVNSGRFLHRAIAEMKIGRPLKAGEVVHHIDRDKLNNHPDNLMVMTASEHASLHAMESRS